MNLSPSTSQTQDRELEGEDYSSLVPAYLELESTQILYWKWREIVVDVATAQSTLQDISLPESCGSHCYKDFGKLLSWCFNRLIYWKTFNDQLELVELSSELNLIGNQIRIKFTNAPILQSVNIEELPEFLVLLVATVSSVHRLILPHPRFTVINQNVINKQFSANSILQKLTTELFLDPQNYHVLNSSNSLNSSISYNLQFSSLQHPIWATSWLDANSNNVGSDTDGDCFASFALSYPRGSITIVKFVSPITSESTTNNLNLTRMSNQVNREQQNVLTWELKQNSSIIGRLWSKMPAILAAKNGQSSSDNESECTALQCFAIKHTSCTIDLNMQQQDCLIFALCRDFKLRIWSTSTRECVHVYNICTQSSSNLSDLNSSMQLHNQSTSSFSSQNGQIQDQRNHLADLSVANHQFIMRVSGDCTQEKLYVLIYMLNPMSQFVVLEYFCDHNVHKFEQKYIVSTPELWENLIDFSLTNFKGNSSKQILWALTLSSDNEHTVFYRQLNLHFGSQHDNNDIEFVEEEECSDIWHRVYLSDDQLLNFERDFSSVQQHCFGIDNFHSKNSHVHGEDEKILTSDSNFRQIYINEIFWKNRFSTSTIHKAVKIMSSRNGHIADRDNEFMNSFSQHLQPSSQNINIQNDKLLSQQSAFVDRAIEMINKIAYGKVQEQQGADLADDQREEMEQIEREQWEKFYTYCVQNHQVSNKIIGLLSGQKRTFDHSKNFGQLFGLIKRENLSLLVPTLTPNYNVKSKNLLDILGPNCGLKFPQTISRNFEQLLGRILKFIVSISELISEEESIQIEDYLLQEPAKIDQFVANISSRLLTNDLLDLIKILGHPTSLISSTSQQNYYCQLGKVFTLIVEVLDQQNWTCDNELITKTEIDNHVNLNSNLPARSQNQDQNDRSQERVQMMNVSTSSVGSAYSPGPGVRSNFNVQKQQKFSGKKFVSSNYGVAYVYEVLRRMFKSRLILSRNICILFNSIEQYCQAQAAASANENLDDDHYDSIVTRSITPTQVGTPDAVGINRKKVSGRSSATGKISRSGAKKPVTSKSASKDNTLPKKQINLELMTKLSNDLIFSYTCARASDNLRCYSALSWVAECPIKDNIDRSISLASYQALTQIIPKFKFFNQSNILSTLSMNTTLTSGSNTLNSVAAANGRSSLGGAVSGSNSSGFGFNLTNTNLNNTIIGTISGSSPSTLISAGAGVRNSHISSTYPILQRNLLTNFLVNGGMQFAQSQTPINLLTGQLEGQHLNSDDVFGYTLSNSNMLNNLANLICHLLWPKASHSCLAEFMVCSNLPKHLSRYFELLDDWQILSEIDRSFLQAFNYLLQGFPSKAVDLFNHLWMNMTPTNLCGRFIDLALDGSVSAHNKHTQVQARSTENATTAGALPEIVNSSCSNIRMSSPVSFSGPEKPFEIRPEMIYKYFENLIQLFKLFDYTESIVDLIQQAVMLLSDNFSLENSDRDDNNDVENPDQHDEPRFPKILNDDDYAKMNHMKQIEEWVNDLRTQLFKYYLDLDMTEEAYQAMVLNTNFAHRNNCLHQFIVHHCETQQWRGLLSFQYYDLRDDFVCIFEKRAATTDLLALAKDEFKRPSYYEILYSFFIGEDQLDRAASVMYEFAQRLCQEVPGIKSISKQADCLLIVLNCLRCMQIRYDDDQSQQATSQSQLTDDGHHPNRVDHDDHDEPRFQLFSTSSNLHLQINSTLTKNNVKSEISKNQQQQQMTNFGPISNGASTLKRGYECDSEFENSPSLPSKLQKDEQSKNEQIQSQNNFQQQEKFVYFRQVEIKYELTRARLRLLERDARVNAIALSPLKCEEIISHLIGSSMFTYALDLCVILRSPMEPVMEGLAAKYIFLSQLSPLDITSDAQLQQNLTDCFVSNYTTSATGDAFEYLSKISCSDYSTPNSFSSACRSPVDRLWLLIDFYLDRYDGISHMCTDRSFVGTFLNTTVLMKTVANKLLEVGYDIPASLRRRYMLRNPAELLRLLIKYDQLLQASDVCVEMFDAIIYDLPPLIDSTITMTNSINAYRNHIAPVYMPTHLILVLIEYLNEDATNKDHVRVANELHKKLLSYRHHMLSLSNATLDAIGRF